MDTQEKTTEQKLAEAKKGLERALAYLEHPEVKAIKFVSPSWVLANQIREWMEKN